MISDDDIIQLIARSDKHEQGMRLLVDKYHQRIYHHIRHILISHDDANDVTQESFIKIWQNIKNFRGDSSLYSWIYRIATNEAINFIRRNKKHKYLVRESTENYLSNLLISDSFIDGDEIQLNLQKVVVKLPDQQRLIFNMRYFEEIKFKDIAAILNLSEGGVKSTYHIAEKKVKDFFKTD